jgi:transglutaminase-like putative cysteine protease
MSAAVCEVPDSLVKPIDDGLGKDYWRRRLARIGFRGDRILAILNENNESRLALVQAFRNVEVIKSAGAMAVPLPYEDALFDSVLYDGIGQPVPSVSPLSEFHRILRPGGRAYFCLAADAWFRRLLSDPTTANPARGALYKTACRRANDAGLADRLGRFASRPKIGLLRAVAPLMILAAVDAGRELLAQVKHLGKDAVTQLRSDVRHMLRGNDLRASQAGFAAVQPDEFARFANVAGFVDFQWAAEGGLITDWLADPVPPRFPGYLDGQLAVWECLMTRPGPVTPPADPARHIATARHAAATPLFLEPGPKPVISNRSFAAFPSALLDHARGQAALFGGTVYLKKLAQAITDGSSTEDDAARRLIRFVQASIFRDPISQPVNADGSLPDPATILFCARGRCGHCSSLLAELANAAGLEARVRQLPSHVTCEMRVARRWVIADADAFKHGILPVNRSGDLVSMDELDDDPYLLDRFPATGWYMRPGTRYTRAAGGSQVTGYVDACEPERRGFVSGYYVPRAVGYPPTLPANLRWTRAADRFRLEWSPSEVRGGRLVEYRVYVSSTPRGWTYDDLGDDKLVAEPLAGDVLSIRTTKCSVDGPILHDSRRLHASVVAVSDRIELEPKTCFPPSDEAVLLVC